MGNRRRHPQLAHNGAEVLFEMTKQRLDVETAEQEWKRRKNEDLEKLVNKWGDSGLTGAVANGLRPRGKVLLNWCKEHNGEGGSGSSDGASS